MKVRVYLKSFLLLMFVWLGFSMNENIALAEDLPEGIGASVVTGSAITYYIGGEGASDTNDGISSTTPFATLYQATSTINSQGEGDYEILVQGDTTETQTSTIGKYGDIRQRVTIKNLTSNVYTINRGSNLDDMICVYYYCSLFLGNQDGSDEINLIINGDFNNTKVESSIINNWGYLYLYNGVSLRNNKCIGNNGSAVQNDLYFNMYGGEICYNEGLKFGAIYNGNQFYLHNGKIYDNYSSSNGGGVYDNGMFKMYNGSISSNTCERYGGGVCTQYSNIFFMYGGMINDNVAILDGGGVYTGSGFKMENGSVINNSTTFGLTGGVKVAGYGIYNTMSGGNISGNKGVGVNITAGSYFTVTGGSISGNDGIGVNVENDSYLTITGGVITGNTITGVAVLGDIHLGGNASIHTNGDSSTNIVLNSASSKIYIENTLIGSEPYFVTPYDYTKGSKILNGSSDILSEAYTKFCFSDSSYTLNGDGRIVLRGEVLTYYVGGTSASDSNDGFSSLSPFATLQKAVSAISYDRGKIIVQSNLLISRQVVIYGDVSIISDGIMHKLNRDTKYFSYDSNGSKKIYSMFIIYGKLTLGDDDNTDMTNNLIIHAFNDPRSYVDGPLDTLYIDTSGEVNLYNGAVLDANNRGAAVYNKGKFNMYGGSISNNVGPFAGGIYNCVNGNCTMSGGTILYNETEGSYINGVVYGSGGVFNIGNSTFTMTGGSIYSNSGYSSGGIYNGTNCTFTMTGGTIGINYIAQYATGVFNDTGAKFIIGQDANILPEDDIWLVEGSTITVNSRLGVPRLWIITISAKFDTRTRTYYEVYTSGTQIVMGGAGYDLSSDKTWHSVMLNTNDYYLNEQGRIVKYIKSEWISLPKGTEYTYTGVAISPLVKIVDGMETLHQGIDYMITYDDNPSVGQHYINIAGIGDYGSEYRQSYIISPAVLSSIITTVEDKTFSAKYGYSISQLKNSIKTPSVKVSIDGGYDDMSVSWNLTGGTFDYHGGTYTFTGTLLDNVNVKSGGASISAQVIVTPMIAKEISFADINIPIGVNRAATTADLGKSILPTSGSYYQEGAYNSGYPNPGTITYTIDWGNQTLDTTNNKNKTTFIGKVTYVNYPEWLTIPENVTVTRTVGVTGKNIVDIQCEINSKMYDGKPVVVAEPSNEQGYTGEYECLYTSTDGKGYSSKTAPKNAGSYKYIVSIPEDNTDFVGSKEILFYIQKKPITLRADNKRIQRNDPLPLLTYQGTGELVDGDTWIMEPKVSAPDADISRASDYRIKMEADAGDNYSILLEDGVLSVLAPSSYTITATSGANGMMIPGEIQSVPRNADITFDIRPNTNYRIAAVLVDGVDVGKVYSYTFHNVVANHNISVSFEVIPVDKPPVAPPPPPFIPFFPPASDDTATPSPTPTNTPTPTPLPKKGNAETSGRISLIGSDAEATISIEPNEEQGSLNISVDLTESVLQNHSADITIPINADQLQEQIENAKIKDINVAITIPKELQSNNNIKSVLEKDLVAAAKESGKDITVSVNDEKGKEQYAWTFTGSNLAASEQGASDVNLSLSVETIQDTELKELLSGSDRTETDGKGLVIHFDHHGDLPSQAGVRIFVGNQDGVKTGDKVLLYHYNSETNKLDSLPISSGYIVDADGYVTVQILHCSDYVLLKETPNSNVVTALIDQINVAVTNKILYFGGTTGDSSDYIIKMPNTLEWVSLNDKTSSSVAGAVNIAFRSSDSKVVAIDNKGHMIAKTLGNCTISAKISLYDGTVKTIKTVVVVKEPNISLSKSKKVMKIGNTFTFETNLAGFKQTDIKWSTTEKSIINIDAKTGKAKAISPGTDYVIAQAGSKKVRIKVMVTK